MRRALLAVVLFTTGCVGAWGPDIPAPVVVAPPPVVEVVPPPVVVVPPRPVIVVPPPAYVPRPYYAPRSYWRRW